VASIDLPEFEFPASYPLKIMGRAVPEFSVTVIDIVVAHDVFFDRETILIKESSKGTFTSINLVITATDREMLDALYTQLMACGLVNMVL
jgi:putative lipoic acid-binding regulatory protein